ncbi:uncharacterized protein PADG_03051 [Paracoccidioides brasiliensis Pb18]|uniref:N-alpha-acetyltransferase 40 n=2 Tax=Paracoccidioides brasiliensis TaxID=121759 RepID=C1G796_PARBD|nr:uncharacterized protein PADG_03051 [Paracoccidioides brasiliensis Pb18]EEH46953.2 hypothetical protein PADG_03051 [Paracoccidioides brasiliensis Pb18]ODH50264.1 hypothetical protein GX48_03536 [Paracoccidioides brasiliensis]
MEQHIKEAGNDFAGENSMEKKPEPRKRASKEEKPQHIQRRLVESVNELPFDEFINRYVPPRIHDFSISVPRLTTTPTDLGTYDTYSIEMYSSSSISLEDLESCFLLVKLTSSEMYKNSAGGWSPKKKKNEMKLLDLRYMLLVRTTTGQGQDQNSSKNTGSPVTGGRAVGGFLAFMVTYEDGFEVIYCYEIHLAPELQHKGLGKILFGFYEEIGRKIGVQKAMLTLFKANKAAIRFYERLGYGRDEFSPKPMKLRNGNTREYDYMIFSKDLGGMQTIKKDTNNMDIVL